MILIKFKGFLTMPDTNWAEGSLMVALGVNTSDIRKNGDCSSNNSMKLNQTQ